MARLNQVLHDGILRIARQEKGTEPLDRRQPTDPAVANDLAHHRKVLFFGPRRSHTDAESRQDFGLNTERTFMSLLGRQQWSF